MVIFHSYVSLPEGICSCAESFQLNQRRKSFGIWQVVPHSLLGSTSSQSQVINPTWFLHWHSPWQASLPRAWYLCQVFVRPVNVPVNKCGLWWLITNTCVGIWMNNLYHCCWVGICYIVTYSNPKKIEKKFTTILVEFYFSNFFGSCYGYFRKLPGGTWSDYRYFKGSFQCPLPKRCHSRSLLSLLHAGCDLHKHGLIAKWCWSDVWPRAWCFSVLQQDLYWMSPSWHRLVSTCFFLDETSFTHLKNSAQGQLPLRKCIHQSGDVDIRRDLLLLICCWTIYPLLFSYRKQWFTIAIPVKL